MNAASVELSDPKRWSNPPVPESWWPAIREATPPFDRRTTPVTRLGRTPELFRTWPGVVRSDHPVGSFCALGPNAEAITAEHDLEDMLGDASPLGRLYELGASVLLLGVGHTSNTSLHLAESRWGIETQPDGAPVMRDGRRVWIEYAAGVYDDSDFDEIGAAYAESGGTVRAGRVGVGRGTLAPVRELIDFATDWMVKNRSRSV